MGSAASEIVNEPLRGSRSAALAPVPAAALPPNRCEARDRSEARCSRALALLLLICALSASPAGARSVSAAPRFPGDPPVVDVLPSRPAALSPAQAPRPHAVVLCARSLDGRLAAWLGGETGLLISGWFGAGGPTLSIVSAAYPRFAADGRLLIEVGEDDGERLLHSATWVLDPGRTTLRPPFAGETLPGWQAPSATTQRPGDVGAPHDHAATAAGAPIKVAVDAGHGGSDSGGVGNGLLEKDVNLDVALRLSDLLDADSADTGGGGDWDVLLTRASDVFVSLQQRVTLANSFVAASFVAIHSNAFSNPSANGTETYAWAEGTTAAALRDKVHAEMIAAWGLTDRGTKTANFYVLVNTTMPASLSEMGFITNPGDAAFLGDPQARQDMALAHLFAIQAHHGFVPYDPTGGPLAGTLKGILYDATMGTGAPIANATVALSDGSFTTTNASGFYSFALAAGSYQFAATAPGFGPAQAGETVTSGDVWESLGLPPGSLPGLTLTVSGNNLGIDIGGDPGSVPWLLFAFTPGLPLASVGLKGVLWPEAATMTILPLTATPANGNLHLDIALPSIPGLNVHVQALAAQQGLTLLSNGAAFALP